MAVRQLWQMWEEGIPDHVIDDLERKFQPERFVDANFGGVSDHETLDQIRDCQTKWVDHVNGIQDLLLPFINDANENAFRFDIERIGDIRYIQYGGQNYDRGGNNKCWHNDVLGHFCHNLKYDRKLTVHIQMSDDHESEGGDFMFKWAEQPPKDALRKKGTVIVFPSYLDHKISKVTEGENRVLICWVNGPNWR